jgi:uncharacterized membrane protein
MRGRILGFDPDTNTGAIGGDDGQRYDFARIDWHGGTGPTHGIAIDFIPAGQRATQIYPVVAAFDPGEGSTANTVYILYLVSLILGVTAIVGLVMAYVNRSDAPEWVQTHYRLQIRTFWIGVLYAVISAVTLVAVIGAFFGLFTLIWWIVRCAKGMKQIQRGQAYDKPANWLW